MRAARRSLTLLLACAALAPAAERQPQRFLLDRLTEVYGWYDADAGALTVITPSGFAVASVERRRLTAGEALSEEQLRDRLKLRQEQLAAYETAYAAAAPARDAERARRAEAAKAAAEERRQREEREAAEAERVAAENRQRRQELADALARIRAQQLEEERVRAEQERAQAERERAEALKRIADAEMLRALEAQRIAELARLDPTHWRFVRSPEDPVGHWVRIEPAPPAK
jgi:hypothetical protein